MAIKFDDGAMNCESLSSTNQLIQTLKASCVDLDDEVFSYICGFLCSSAHDELISSSENGLLHFIEPWLPQHSVGAQLCSRYLTTLSSLKCASEAAADAAVNLPTNTEVKSPPWLAVKGGMRLGDADTIYDALVHEKSVVDVAHHSISGSSFLSQVDKKKLDKAEAKLKLKQEGRVAAGKSTVRIPVDFIDITPDKDYHALNTHLDPSLSKGKSKDVHLHNFDISFGGRKILTDANLTLASGFRYGLLGRNGVG